MNCDEIREDLSALHDGERIEPPVARHVGGCDTCRDRLREYAAMGLELRLEASAGASPAPPLRLPGAPRRAGWLQGLGVRMLVPRFAVALGLTAIAGLSVGIGVVQGKDRSPWFRYEAGPAAPAAPRDPRLPPDPPHFLRAGTREVLTWTEPDGVLAAELELVAIRGGAVKLSARAIRLPGDPGSAVILDALQEAPAQRHLYLPGQVLEIPAGGGGPVALRGSVTPVRPARDEPAIPALGEQQLAVENVALLAGDRVFDWGSTGMIVATGADAALELELETLGRFLVSLQPFEGAVPAEAYGSRLQFRAGGDDFTVYSSSRLAGGPQPRTLWVRHDPGYATACGFCITASSLEELLGAEGSGR